MRWAKQGVHKCTQNFCQKILDVLELEKCNNQEVVTWIQMTQDAIQLKAVVDTVTKT